MYCSPDASAVVVPMVYFVAECLLILVYWCQIILKKEQSTYIHDAACVNRQGNSQKEEKHMPAAYAHHRFGETCLNRMNPKMRMICMKYRELYDIGVHGPDILFYYNPLTSNKVNRHGQELHNWTGAQFFTVAKYSFQEATEHRKAMMAYLLGFLAHFVLDSGCHDFIEESAEESGLSHNLIESQYETFLMEKDGLNPMKVDRSGTLHPSMSNAEIISRFFPFEEEEILKSLKGQKRILHLFYSPSGKKKKAVRKLIDTIGIKGDFGDLFLDREHLWQCEMMNEILWTRQKAAAELYPKLARNLVAFLYDREKPVEYFQYDFEGVLRNDQLGSSSEEAEASEAGMDVY